MQFKQRGIETVRRPTFLRWRLRHFSQMESHYSLKDCRKWLIMIGPDLLSSSIFVCLFRWTKSNCLYRMYHWVPQWGALLMPGERHRSRLRALISTITHLFDWFVRFLHWVAHVNTKHSAHQYKAKHTFFALICPPGAVTYFLADTFCSALQLWSNDVWLRNFHICIGASSFVTVNFISF